MLVKERGSLEVNKRKIKLETKSLELVTSQYVGLIKLKIVTVQVNSLLLREF